MKRIGDLSCTLGFLGPVLKIIVEVHCSMFLFLATRTFGESSRLFVCGAQCISR